ncbi:L-type lectin-domain containing receptor kinase IV.1-like isoform X2 [Trifolium pratense]|uniref:L-type lectin-domain containing receptor kinase IV.1-like isoform X2 n=1 Tax=Trifolium pratense TaxID=57577 RepID=UPI001E696B19|nr:L-type lectin-domain containing receptor kinase IV.1-like isoform X2 [Trifolium pratense]XP_045794329.1 L-type lectin-domain containing receptor kinase IV.1-like isoform X2 [Trifolium pratense]
MKYANFVFHFKQNIVMFLKLVFMLFFLVTLVASKDNSFTYNGFQSSDLDLDGTADVIEDGLLRLTNDNTQVTGHAFYPNPIVFKKTSDGSVSSFSTTFVFAIRSQYPKLNGHGIVFVVSPTNGFPNSLPSQYLGLFNSSNIGNSSNHVFGVELDTLQEFEFDDINNNHVGIDINDLKSYNATPAGYYDDENNGQLKNLTLFSGNPMQVWIEYDSEKTKIDVTLAPINVVKPTRPLLSTTKDLSPIFNNTMYVGFSSTTGLISSYHDVLGWSFKVDGQVKNLIISKLPTLARFSEKKESKILTVGLPLILLSLVFMITLGVMYYIKRKKFTEILEDWEHEYGPHRFKFKDLYFATKGFKEKGLLGVGGFGRVYKGVIPSSKLEVAVKRVSHESKQGMREFVSEIVSIGRLRHRNLVPLLGYCRRKDELLLVYEYMPNGSLDNYLHKQPKVTLNWSQRFRIIKGVASGLFYLHEEWEQVVIHRDIKASNVMLDSEFNARLGDFGLSRLYDHGADPDTTHVAGTVGYLAPEHTRTGKATKFSDVYAFGAFLLEVVCGRRPIDRVGKYESVILVDLVFECWKRGEILEAKDVNLGSDYVSDEVELVLKLGLLCSHSEPLARPSMRQVMQYLERDIPLPDLSLLSLSSFGLTFGYQEQEVVKDKTMSHISVSVTESLLSGGR